MIHFSAWLIGFVFGLGLAMSGMTMPTRVLGFLDVFGAWDPTLMFVMIGAIGVHATAYRLILKRETPLLDRAFLLPTATKLDKSLITGAGIFGIGWGLAGYCPGPALTSLAGLAPEAVGFVAMMAVGMSLAAWNERRRGRTVS